MLYVNDDQWKAINFAILVCITLLIILLQALEWMFSVDSPSKSVDDYYNYNIIIQHSKYSETSRKFL